MKTLLAMLAVTTTMTGAALAQDTARIALLHGLSGSPLEAYSKQTHTGFELGLEYATDGTMRSRACHELTSGTSSADIARACSRPMA